MQTSKQRRLFLKTAVASSTVGLAVAAGLITPSVVLAQWNEKAFKAAKVDEAVKNLFDGTAADSDKITVKVPDVAENGAVVPVTISSTLENIENITLLVEQNASPLTASFDVQPNVEGMISIRVKVGKSSDIIGVVKADGKLFTARKAVKVTLGGCG